MLSPPTQENPPPVAFETPDASLVHSQLERMLEHRLFRLSPRLAKLFTYTVEQALNGSDHRLKEYSIALEVFSKPESFDPRMDSAVRVAARQLRAKVDLYYLTDGAHDPVLIRYRPGDYVPRFYTRSVDTVPDHDPDLQELRAATVVHRDRTTVRTIVDALDYCGVAVTSVVDTGEKALSVLPTMGPGVVVAGLDLAGYMSGPDLTIALRRDFDAAMLVVLPVTADLELIRQLAMADPDGVVYQPVRPPDMQTALRLAAVRHHLNRLRHAEDLRHPSAPGGPS